MKKIKNYLLVILFFLASFGIGIMLGMKSNILGMEFGGGELVFSWWDVLLAILLFYFSLYVQVAIHEAGHVVGGLLTGYRFLSYRISHFHWQKVEGKIKLYRYSIVGTLGQALMIPPQPVDGKVPYMLYNLGGGMANLLTVPVFWWLGQLTTGLDLLWNCLILLGILGFVTQLLPLGNQFPNDGYNIQSIKNHPQGSLYFYAMMTINANMVRGGTFQEMDDDLFLEADSEHLSNPIIFHAVLNKTNRLLALGDYQTARDYLTSLNLEHQDLAQILRILSKVMLSYLDLLCDQTTSVSFDKKERKLVEALSRYQPMFLLYLYAYHGLVTGDDEKSLKARADFEAMEKNYPFIVDYEDEKSRLGLFEQCIAERKKQDD